MEQILVNLIESGYPKMALVIIGIGLLLSFLIVVLKLLNERYYFKSVLEKDNVEVLRVGHKKNEKILKRFKKDNTKDKELRKDNNKKLGLRIVHRKKPLL